MRIIPSFLGIVALLIFHRVLAIRLVPPLPPAGGGSLLSFAWSHYARRLLGCSAFAVLAVLASLVFHAQLLRPCDGPAPCSSFAAATTAAWASLVGAALGVGYWREVWQGGARGGTLAFPPLSLIILW